LIESIPAPIRLAVIGAAIGAALFMQQMNLSTSQQLMRFMCQKRPWQPML
jgi:hypothetical protein